LTKLSARIFERRRGLATIFRGVARSSGSSRTPRVGLVGLLAGGQSGVPRYAAALTRALDGLAPTISDFELMLLTTAAGAERVQPRHMEATVVAGRARAVNAGPLRLLLEHTQLRRTGADVLHFFDLSGPVLAPRHPFVATTHDASAARGFRRFHNSYKHVLYPWAARNAGAIIAVSAFAKDEAVRHFAADPNKVVVVHSGPGLVGDDDGSRHVSADDLGRYLLYVGNIGENKNLPMLIRAFDAVDQPVRLLLVGRPREGFDAVRAAIDGSASSERIRVISNASDSDLDALYRSAVALVLPSTYEGFGFTPLEAMARSCPVLASDIPAVREISGAGATLLPPFEETAWAEAMRTIVSDENARNELRARGAETVKGYSWEKTARGVADVLRTVLQTSIERGA
jgi:glycosyltransferase involved in cell wall biosynthesis